MTSWRAEEESVELSECFFLCACLHVSELLFRVLVTDSPASGAKRQQLLSAIRMTEETLEAAALKERTPR